MITQELAEASDEILGILGAMVDDFNDDKHAYIQKRHVVALLQSFSRYVEAINGELDRGEPDIEDESGDPPEEPSLT